MTLLVSFARKADYKNASFFLYIFLSKARSVPGRATGGRPLFAPHSQLTLVAPFRGAKSSQFRRRISTSQALGALSLCSPLPANPCSSVSGSKIFTFPPPDYLLPGARRLFLFAPPSPQTLAAPFRGAKFSHSRRRISSSLPLGGRPLFAPHSPRTLVAPFRGAKSSHFRRRISTSQAPGARPLFAPRYPQTLVAPFRGAKSSHSRRRL